MTAHPIHTPKAASALRRNLTRLFLAFLALLTAFLIGMQVTLDSPDAMYGPGNYLRQRWQALTLVTGRVFAPSLTDADLQAMRTNSFTVSQNEPGLTGTVMFALRELSWKMDYYPSRAVEIDRSGKVVWEYRIDPETSPFAVVSDVRKLSNGNVLMVVADRRALKAFVLGTTVSSLPSKVIEVDRQGQIVREIPVVTSHHAEYLPNGHLLTVSSVEDTAREVDSDGNIVWQWRAADHIFPNSSSTYVGYYRSITLKNIYALNWMDRLEGRDSEWTHMNSAQRLANGNTVLSLRNLDLVVEVNPEGNVVWTYGALVLKHQHCAWILPNDHLLVTDNGNARVIEVDRATQQIVWEYNEGLHMPDNACAYRLPSGNTLITDSYNKRVIEVTPDKRIVWNLQVNTPTSQLYRAWWSPE